MSLRRNASIKDRLWQLIGRLETDTLDQKTREALAGIITIERETSELRLAASIVANRLTALKVEHELEKKRLRREKPGNLGFLLGKHNEEIRKCDLALQDLEKGKASLTDLLEEITMARNEVRQAPKEAQPLLFSIDRLRSRFEEISWKIGSCEEVLKTRR